MLPRLSHPPFISGWMVVVKRIENTSTKNYWKGINTIRGMKVLGRFQSRFLSLSPLFLSRSCFIETDIWNATTFDQARLEIFLTVPFKDIRSTTTTTTVSSVLTDLHVRSCKKSLKQTTCELLLEFLLTNAPVSNLSTTQYRPYYSLY